MQPVTALARGGIAGAPALGNRDSFLPSSPSPSLNAAPSRQRQRINASSSRGGGLFPLSSTSPRRFSSMSTRALRGPGTQEPACELRFQRKRRPVSSPFALATAANLPLSTAPAALRASDSDDPSDEDVDGEEDDPASELTAEEIAMAFSEDIKPREEEEEDEEEEEEEVEVDEAEFNLATAAASSRSTAVSAASATDDGDEDDARALALELARVAADTKASDVVVLHVAPLVYWTSYMVLCTVYSRPQLGAVLAKSEQAAAGDRFGRDLSGARGAGRSPWEVLDFGDVVMHCFTPDQREFYDLEGFYGAAEEVELPEAVSSGGGPAAAAAAGARPAAKKRDAASWANRA